MVELLADFDNNLKSAVALVLAATLSFTRQQQQLWILSVIWECRTVFSLKWKSARTVDDCHCQKTSFLFFQQAIVIAERIVVGGLTFSMDIILVKVWTLRGGMDIILVKVWTLRGGMDIILAKVWSLRGGMDLAKEWTIIGLTWT
mgnify:CR=1 FL=1